MINNGGIVVATLDSEAGNEVVVSQWVPIYNPSTSTLSPTFATGTTSYTAYISPTATGLRVTPTGSGTITVRVNSAAATTVTSGATHTVTSLNTGANTVTITAASGGSTRTYTVNVLRGVPGIVLSESALSLTEGTSPTDTYTVKLATPPTSGVKVRAARGAANYVLNKSGGSEYIGQDLTFTTQSWNTAQTITVRALDDPDALAGTSNITHTTVDADTAAEYDSVSKNLPVTVTDDDAALVVSRGTGALALTEEDDATYTVALKGQPAGNVVVRVTSDDTGAVTAAPGTLTFTTGDWNTPQTVTVRGVEDADSVDETVRVTHAVDDASSSDEFDPADDVTFLVNVTDNTVGLDVGAVSGPASEAGGTATFPVALLSQPTAAVTVSVSSRDTGEGTVEPSSLTFAAAAWSTAQTVTVTGVDDNVDDGTVAWNVSLVPASGDAGYNILAVAEEVSVTTTDDDGPPAVTLALTPASIAESGTGNVATVTARLSHPSGAATTLTVAAGTAWAAGADPTIVIAAGATTSTDTATVVAADNDTDEPDRSGTVTATVTNDRAAADSTTMTVTGAALAVRDDDAAPGATLALDPASVSENGGVSTVTATLSHPSSEPSTVTVAAVSGAYTVGTDATITIAAGATTAASDTVLVTAVDDDVHQGTAGRSATVTGTLANGQGAGAVTGAALALTDDEDVPTVSLAFPASVSENGGIATVTARLSGPSTTAATVTVATAAVASTGAVAGDFTQTGTTLTLAAGSRTSTGLVTVTAHDNAVDAANKQVQVSGTTTGGNGMADPADATLTLADDETLPTAALVLNPSSISEAGGVSTVTATLTGASSEAVTLTVAAAAVSPAVSADFTRSSANTLTIAAGATTSTGLVTVTAHDNAVAAPSKRVTVSATAAGGNGVAAPSDVPLTLRDDESSLAESAVSGPVTEAGGTATFTVALRAQPTEAVTVAVTSRDTGEGTVDPSSLTFTTTTWSTAQTVTVTGVDDDVDDGDVVWQVRLETSSGDSNFAALADVDVDVTTTDDDTAGVAASPSSGLVTTERGGEATFTVRLSSEPVGNVALDVASSNTDEGTVAPSTLTFTGGSSGNWGTAQTVTVTGVDDADVDGDESYTVTLVIDQADTADPTYDTLGTVSVSVVNRDNDGVSADVNGDGAINGLDGLLMYYAYTFEETFKLETEVGRRVRGFLRTLRGPASPAANEAGYKAMLDNAYDWESADRDEGDVNGDGTIDGLDGLLMYYAYTFEETFKLETEVGRRVRGFLRTLRGPASPAANEAGYKAMLDNAYDWESADRDEGDVNGDGTIDGLDGLLMYYAYTFEETFRLSTEVGRRVRGFLSTLRGPASPAANDAGYKAMLDKTWRLQQ